VNKALVPTRSLAMAPWPPGVMPRRPP